MLKQGLDDSIAVAKKQLSESTQTRAVTEEELHTAEASLAETQETLAADTKYLEELKMSCETKETEWAARQKQASRLLSGACGYPMISDMIEGCVMVDSFAYCISRRVAIKI